MANKNFNTRIQLKYDTYVNWTTNNPTPLSGEVCIVVIPAETGAVTQEPSVLFKVGDGATAFNSLPYVSAVAADVYDWAKAASKPTYAADEIDGLAAYISGEIQDTDTQYKLEKNASNPHIIELYSKPLDGEWSLVGNITTADTVYDDTALAGRVTALEGLVGSTAVATQIGNAIAALKLAETYEAKGAAAAVQGTTTKTVKDVEDAVAAIDDGTTIHSFKSVETALAGKQPTGDYATKTEAQGYANAKDDAIAAAKKAGDDAQADVDTLKAKVGTVPAEKTVVQMITEAQAAATYDDAEVRGLIGDNTNKVGTLIGSDAGKSVRTIANEELAAQLIPESAKESLDTLAEIAAWIQSHPDDASAMNAAIEALQEKVDTGDKTVSGYVTDAIAALKIGDYAKASELTALAARVTTAESDIDALELEVAKKANDADLKPVAKSGNVSDLIQTDGEYLIFNCGSSSTVI